MFKITLDNTQSALMQLDIRTTIALEECGIAAERFAKAKCPVGKVNGGNLRNSITHNVDGNTMTVGAGAKYATYVECGTGSANYPGGTTKDHWVYKGDDGKFHIGHPMAARPFIKPSLEEHTDYYLRVLEEKLKG